MLTSDATAAQSSQPRCLIKLLDNMRIPTAADEIVMIAADTPMTMPEASSLSWPSTLDLDAYMVANLMSAAR